MDVGILKKFIEKDNIMPSTLNMQNVKISKKLADNGVAWFNCWGATLFCLNEIEELEWISQTEMEDYLNTHTVKVDNKFKKGDILALFNEDDEYVRELEEFSGECGLLHTAVYLYQDKFFHKRGGLNAEIATLEQILADYPCDYYENRRKVNYA